jgi:ribosomal-protein-alanine acetyltransferase
VTLRTALPADLDAIMALERASFPTDAWSAAMMREELVSPHGWYVVDEEAGRLVGYAGLRAVKSAKDADVQTIAIAEAARGRGRGRSLLRALLDEAARRGVAEVFLEVRADNPVAQALYASEGFLEIGRKPRYYQPDDVDAVVMKLDVRGWASADADVGAATGGACT